ncbi:6057_t:CDS:2 [Paraglomus brasilianum]|uniref:6057_t:CDS:1 n=1 Tax=Paraglomus brasilianum TaxID=144538 RepID=A0A9N9FPC1_9GLOM|nr:6057_t:CDS:2 [Paraglomus brasilianum]
MRYDVSIRQDNSFSRSPIFALTFSPLTPNSRLSQTSGNSLAAFHNTYLGAIPHIPHSIPDFTAFELFASRFYSDPSIYPACQSLYQHHIRTVLTRRNTFNGKLYKEDPVEESARGNHKSLGDDRNRREEWKCTSAATLVRNNMLRHMDYASAHVWVENWDITIQTENYSRAENFMLNSVDKHERMLRESYRSESKCGHGKNVSTLLVSEQGALKKSADHSSLEET